MFACPDLLGVNFIRSVWLFSPVTLEEGSAEYEAWRETVVSIVQERLPFMSTDNLLYMPHPSDCAYL